MKTRKLGGDGLEVSAEGLGCMGMSEFYGAADEAEATATIQRALELGVVPHHVVHPGLLEGWGASHPDLEQNAAASEIELSAEDLRRIDAAAPQGAASGDRYADMAPLDR